MCAVSACLSSVGEYYCLLTKDVQLVHVFEYHKRLKEDNHKIILLLYLLEDHAKSVCWEHLHHKCGVKELSNGPS